MAQIGTRRGTGVEGCGRRHRHSDNSARLKRAQLLLQRAPLCCRRLLQAGHASAHLLGQMAHQIELPPHGGEVLGVVSRSIARGSRRTAPTPGERVNGAPGRPPHS